MSQVRTFFRHCPSCGRRFEIRLVSKKPTDSEGFKEEERFMKSATNVSSWPPLGNVSTPPSVVEEHVPLIVDVEAFRYMYRCKHCGHEWLEVHEKDEVERRLKGYTGD